MSQSQNQMLLRKLFYPENRKTVFLILLFIILSGFDKLFWNVSNIYIIYLDMGKFWNQLKKKNENILTESIKIPRDLVQKDSVISLSGNEEVWIENYKGILDYSQERIVLLLRKGRIIFQGRNMFITFYTSEDMQITGKIESILFEK